MYDLQDWAAVQRVYKQTRSKRATAKILGMSRNTVRSLLEVCAWRGLTTENNQKDNNLHIKEF